MNYKVKYTTRQKETAEISVKYNKERRTWRQEQPHAI